MNTTDEPSDLVDEFYRPYIRALGNMVVLFARRISSRLSRSYAAVVMTPS